jgi:hypothetical protein
MGAEAGTDGKHAFPVMAAPSTQRRHTMKKLTPKQRVGMKFCGTIGGNYRTDWVFLEYLGGGTYLVCADSGHNRSEYRKVKLSEIQ